MVNGWHWSGGGPTANDICTESCGDGYVTTSETWEDGNSINLDGWNNACQIEPGWNWVTTASPNSTACTPICGDNYRVAGENWDDGNNADNQGWKADWSGELDGWHWSGGDHTQPDTWIEICGDGFITTNEQCENDNPATDGDGWSSTCQIETGWTWTNNALLTYSTWEPIWGDGLVVGLETWDDGDKNDNKGWNDQCNGIIRGWYCDPNPSAPTPPAHVCHTQLMDGIHISPEEGWDDGNNVDVGDGCTNSGVIEYKWDWVNDILQRSIWVPKWGNGKQDHVDEECDDENYDDNDGWTNCFIDSGWQCFNGSATTRDNWFKQPIASITKLTQTNEITIEFTEPMKNLTLTDSLFMNLTITGPLAPYQFTYQAGFESETVMMINISMTSQMTGEQGEKYLIEFDTSEFLSIHEANLLTKSLYGYLYKIPILPDVLEPIGQGIGTTLSVTLIFLVASNILMGQSSELLWGFMNTMQIMLFFPVLQLYYPDLLAQFFTYFSASKFKFEIPFVEGMKSKFKEDYSVEEKLNMPVLNERYESIEYESTSMLINGESIFQIGIQGFIIWAIIFALKAILFTIRTNVETYEDELKDLERKDNKSAIEKDSSVQLKQDNFIKEEESSAKDSKSRVWLKK
jgi:cysteine-rich repeat protein